MTEVISEWIMGIITVSIISSAAIAMTDNMSGQKYIRYISSLVLMIAVIAPVVKSDLRFSDFSVSSLLDYDFERAEIMSEEYTRDKMEVVLSQKVDEKAESLGLVSEAQIECRITDEGILPYKCRINCEYNETLYEWIHDYIGIDEISWVK